MPNGKYLEIIKEFNACWREDRWEDLENHIHPDYPQFTTIDYTWIHPCQEKDHQDANSMFPFFLKLLGFEGSETQYPQPFYNSSKSNFVLALKWTKRIYKDITILDSFENEDTILLHICAIVNDPKKRDIRLPLIRRYRFKNEKIIAATGHGRYFIALSRYKSLLMKENDSVEIERYMQTLKELNIIPN
ncbi:MAG: hypothetical protein INQ03_03550 [Candidatus Heimdallarchaeota archaeon]|nr:hypothetical protein [Candidatus Heimdallarchaeota archaeon]